MEDISAERQMCAHPGPWSNACVQACVFTCVHLCIPAVRIPVWKHASVKNVWMLPCKCDATSAWVLYSTVLYAWGETWVWSPERWRVWQLRMFSLWSHPGNGGEGLPPSMEIQQNKCSRLYTSCFISYFNLYYSTLIFFLLNWNLIKYKCRNRLRTARDIVQYPSHTLLHKHWYKSVQSVYNMCPMKHIHTTVHPTQMHISALETIRLCSCWLRKVSP